MSFCINKEQLLNKLNSLNNLKQNITDNHLLIDKYVSQRTLFLESLKVFIKHTDKDNLDDVFLNKIEHCLKVDIKEFIESL